MGFSTIVTQIIFFSFLMLIIGAIFLLSKNMLLQDKSTMELTGKLVANKINTHITIENASYAGNTVTAIARNDGSTTLKTEYVDVYIDQVRIPRNITNRTITLMAPDLVNPGLWDPDELLNVLTSFPLSSGNHTIKLVTEYTTSSTKIFEVS